MLIGINIRPYRQYTLAYLAERFSILTLPAQSNVPAYYMGMITANSFMEAGVW